MPRITVNLPSDVMAAADAHYMEVTSGGPLRLNRSAMVAMALHDWTTLAGRPETSARGRIETLRSLRAARAALDELERGLTQAEPVKRRVRRYTPRSQGQRGT